MTATLGLPQGEPSAARAPATLQRQQLRSDDLDEVRAWTMRDSGWHSRVAQGRGRLGFEATVAYGDAIHVGWFRVSLAQCLRGSTPRQCLHLPSTGASRYTFGREAVEVGPGQAILLPRDWQHTRTSEPTAMAGLAIDEDAWQRELRGRDPNFDPNDTVHPRVFDLGAAAQVPLRRAIDELLAVAADAAAPPAQRALAEAAFIDALAAALGRAAAWVRTPSIAAQRLADLEQWIDAHLHKPITLGSLCKVAGVGGRSLQSTFFARRGMSPMRFVTERRLSAARRELEDAGRRTSVSEVALGNGIAHLGRFAIEYRQVFGETPSQTLARRR